MGRNQFAVVGGPEDLAHLRLGVHSVQASASGGVPHADASVACTSSRCKEVGLEWAPSQRFDGSGVVVQRELRVASSVIDIPDVQEVVVASRSELLAIRTPLETADLLSMATESVDVVVGHPDIVVDDGGVSAARGEDTVVPCKCSYTSMVSIHLPHSLLLLNIPQLHCAFISANSEIVSLYQQLVWFSIINGRHILV